ncbi:unnamed protein product [Peronospora farinosa]|uniref:RxLR effector protein n=1 Tax=Peronospora farinosa TaxID=134698 RepID=A0AAV0SZD7_9STRA|nr:unnamed protein product [Peronospora farinosa]CAI5709427.1 unnamed protein product [Peronospora farinosa]
MRLPCVPILFAVATRPVAVGAHAEPSDIVTSDGQFEVQRHLRVQERAHDKDDYERTSPLVEEIISSAEKIEPAITISHPLESASDTSNTLKRPADILESENRPAKIRKTMVNDFLAKANKEKSLTMPTKKGEKRKYPIIDL